MHLQARGPISLILLLMTAMAWAYDGHQQQAFSHQVLKGIGAVSIRVTGIAPDYARYGLKEKDIKAEAGNRLRQAGLRLVSPEQAATIPGGIMLDISLHAVRSDYSYYSYAVIVKVRQKVALKAPGTFASLVTWKQGAHGIALPMELRKIGKAVNGIIDRFVADYRQQNPHPGAS